MPMFFSSNTSYNIFFPQFFHIPLYPSTGQTGDFNKLLLCNIWITPYSIKYFLLACLIHNLIHSFIHSLIHSFIHSFIHSLIIFITKLGKKSILNFSILKLHTRIFAYRTTHTMKPCAILFNISCHCCPLKVVDVVKS